MTQPQQDPPVGSDEIGAALARLAEQVVALQRQVAAEHHLTAELVRALSTLTDAKFVTFNALITSQAEKVALALDSTEKAIGKADAATTKAIDKAEIATTDRFRAVNEFRQQLNDQARTFMPRTEATQLTEQATQRIRELTEVIPKLATRLEVQIMTDRYAERISEVNDRLNRKEGQGEGAKDNKTGLYAALGLAASVIVMVVIVANFFAK